MPCRRILCNSVGRAVVSVAHRAGRPPRQPGLAGGRARFGGRRHPVARRGGAQLRLCDRRPGHRAAAGGDARHVDHRRRVAPRCPGGQRPSAYRPAGSAPRAGTSRPCRRGRRQRVQAAGSGRRGTQGAARELVHGAAQFRRESCSVSPAARALRKPRRIRRRGCRSSMPRRWTAPPSGCRRHGAIWTPRWSRRRWATRTRRWCWAARARNSGRRRWLGWVIWPESWPPCCAELTRL